MPLDRFDFERLRPWAEFAGFAASVAAVIGIEVAQSPEYFERPRSLFAYTVNPETTWVALVLLATPLVWWLGGRRMRALQSPVEAGTGAAVPPLDGLIDATPPRAAMWFSVLVFALSVAFTWLVGRSFRGMPPAYHDEYSYIFQAKTFLAGRFYFPSHALPEFFDQMHVLNDDGVFASRYFPGVGLWLAPWVAIGRPYWGQYLAGGLVTVCVFWLGRELAARVARDRNNTSTCSDHFANTAGLVAAALCVLSPAMLLFGNLLLSHHPTTLGLVAFALAYLRALRSASWGWPLTGGVALGFAMLCRPLTAFGFALPFGLHLGWLMIRGRIERAGTRLVAALAPVGIGLALLACYNAALTGNPFVSPYGKYLRIYTPNHVYGFRNVSRGAEHAGPKVIEHYNRWAEELTLPRAMNLFAERATTSAQWSAGRTTLPWVLAVACVLFVRLPVAWRLVCGAIAGLHAAYFPYAFVGIYGLSYVFETVPMLGLLTAAVAVWLGRTWFALGRWGRVVWLVAFLSLGMIGPLAKLVQLGPDGGIAQVQFSRSYYARFEQTLRAAGVKPPALVFIEPDSEQWHLDLVTNSPSLDDPILRARNRGLSRNLELARTLRDRTFWFYDARTNQLIGGISYDEFRKISEQQPVSP